MVMFRHFRALLKSKWLTKAEKFDAILLLTIYVLPVILFIGIIDSVALFYLGEMQIWESLLVFLSVAAYNSFGNFAPFYQIGTASLLDGTSHRVKLLPFLMFYFLMNIWTITAGFFLAVGDAIFKRKITWDKTVRFRRSE